MGSNSMERRSSLSPTKPVGEVARPRRATVEGTISPSKLATKPKGRPMALDELEAYLKPMNQKDLRAFLFGHHLLKNCSNEKPEHLPKPGELVWARNFGSVYWPGFVAKVQDLENVEDDDEDIDDGAYTFVVFLENTFRYAPIPWKSVIRVAEKDLEMQKFLMRKFNRMCFPKYSGSSMYSRAYNLIDEFISIPLGKRQHAAENRFKKKQEGLAKKRGSITPKPDPKEEAQVPSEKPPAKVEINKVISQTKSKRKSGLRVSDRIVDKQILKIKTESKTTAKKKTDEEKAAAAAAEEKKKAEENPKVKKNSRPGSRPDVGGEMLKLWTKDRFDAISKQYQFESTEKPNCVKCYAQFTETEEIKICHGMPHHLKCLTLVGDPATLKCSMCIDQQCVLCREPGQGKEKPTYKCTRCDLRYHIDCLVNEWPHAEVQGSAGPVTCPVHFCHTCLGEQKIFQKYRDYTTIPSRAYKCLLCLSTYHKTCLPAGCGEDIKGKEYIICPKHKLQELKVRQRRIGCLSCCKPIKSKDDPRVECQYCIQVFHPECLGYTGEICDKISLEVFSKNYKCYTCRWGLYPIYGQVIWYQQPQSQFWPARILYPLEARRRSNFAKRLPGQYSVEYFGGNTTMMYDNAVRCTPLHLTTLEVFKSMKVYQDTPKILRAHEEANFFLHFADQLRDTVLAKPRPVYKEIDRNVYRSIRAPKVKQVTDVCSCADDEKAESICLVDNGCANRDMALECNDKICNGGSRCTNRMFTATVGKNQEEYLQQTLIPGKGWGVVAKKEFNEDDFVSEYRGEVIDGQEMIWRLSKKEEEDPMYILEISKDLFIDAEYVGNISRLINHSCDPNSEVRKYLSQGRHVGGIFARRRIAVGEEITFKYGCSSQSTAPFRCRCGAKRCSTFIGKEVPAGYKEEDCYVDIDKWDDVCSKCGFGGRVICCDYPGCGKVWHYQCIGLSRPPGEKTWYCSGHPPLPKNKRKSIQSSNKLKTKNTSKNRTSKSSKKTDSPVASSESSVPKKKRSNKSSSEKLMTVDDTKPLTSETKPEEIKDVILSAASESSTLIENDTITNDVIGSDESEEVKVKARSRKRKSLVTPTPPERDTATTTATSSPGRHLRSSRLSDSTDSTKVSESDTDTTASPDPSSTATSSTASADEFLIPAEEEDEKLTENSIQSVIPNKKIVQITSASASSSNGSSSPTTRSSLRKLTSNNSSTDGGVSTLEYSSSDEAETQKIDDLDDILFDQISSPTTRSSNKRKRTSDYSSSDATLSALEESEADTEAETQKIDCEEIMDLDLEATQDSLTLVITSPVANRRNGNRTPRRRMSKPSEPFSPLALNSNLIIRTRTASEQRDPLVSRNKNRMATRSSSSGPFTESLLNGENSNSRRSSTTNVIHNEQPIGDLTVDIKHETSDGFNDSVATDEKHQQCEALSPLQKKPKLDVGQRQAFVTLDASDVDQYQRKLNNCH